MCAQKNQEKQKAWEKCNITLKAQKTNNEKNILKIMFTDAYGLLANYKKLKFKDCITEIKMDIIGIVEPQFTTEVEFFLKNTFLQMWKEMTRKEREYKKRGISSSGKRENNKISRVYRRQWTMYIDYLYQGHYGRQNLLNCWDNI